MKRQNNNITENAINQHLFCKFAASWPLSSKKKTSTYVKSIVAFTLLRHSRNIYLLFVRVSMQCKGHHGFYIDSRCNRFHFAQ